MAETLREVGNKVVLMEASFPFVDLLKARLRCTLVLDGESQGIGAGFIRISSSKKNRVCIK